MVPRTSTRDRAGRGFSLAGVAHKIAWPVFVVHAEDDKVVPVASAHKLFDAIGAQSQEPEILTAETGHVHAQPTTGIGIDCIAD